MSYPHSTVLGLVMLAIMTFLVAVNWAVWRGIWLEGKWRLSERVAGALVIASWVIVSGVQVESLRREYQDNSH